MSWQRGAPIAIVGLFLVGCGQAPGPVAVVPPVASQTPTPQFSPTASPLPSPSPKPSPKPSPSTKPTPEPSPPLAVASVTCKGAPGSAMAVVAGVFLYDVADPIHPRLVCRADNTYMQLLEGNKIAYTVALSSGKADVIWRVLATGVNTKVAQLPADPGGAKNWTPDGALEVYAGPGKPINDWSWLIPIHLVSDGGNHVLYSIISGA